MQKGWSQSMLDRVNAIALPEKIKCSACERNRPQTAFSNAQISKLKGAIANKGRAVLSSHPIRCRSCTEGTLSELVCVQCHECRPVDEFSKIQRRKIDTATCRNCVSDNLLAQPWDEYSAETERLDQSSKSSVVEAVVGGVAASDETTSNYSSLLSFGSSTADNDDDDEEDSIAGGVWLDSTDAGTLGERQDLTTTSGDQSSAVSSAAYPRFTSQSEEQSQTSHHADQPWAAVERRSRSSSGRVLPQKSKWAKVKAHDPNRDAYLLRLPETRRLDTDVRGHFEDFYPPGRPKEFA